MEQTYFQRALSDFVFDMASGGAICHLTDLGYTVKQIQEKLSFPTPYERIQKAVWKHLLDTGVIALEEQAKAGEKVAYVREYDRYGKASFRRVTVPVCASESSRPRLLCRFGLLKYQDSERYSEVLGALKPEQAEYIDGLPWGLESVWHRADQRMLEIYHTLERVGLAQDVCFFS
ncbi:MAG: hypothetical protein NC543_10185 [bacterium]|nr:hypothetical protein [bacterium]MCM1374315.1 hypothetical protein [Muribaculum sp.]